MVTSKTACEIARSLPDVSEREHFGSDAFYAHKRIFATVWHDKKQINLRFTPDVQRDFLEIDGEAFLEIDNAWGRQGWTTAQLEFISRDILKRALQAAWECSAVKVARAKSAKKKKPARRR